jgi:hypothetical protein
MRNIRTLRRLVAASLALCAVLTAVSVLTMPAFGGDYTEALAEIADTPTSALSSLLFVLAQLPFAIGFVGVAYLTGARRPVLSFAAATLAVLGAFGHAVYGGVSLLMVDMAADSAQHTTYGALLAGAENGTLTPFLAMGLVGTVLGVVLTGVAVWRAGFGPRWLGAVLVAFVLVEFVGSSLSDWAGYASGLLYLAGLLTLAVEVARTRDEAWSAPAPADAPDRMTLPA